MKNTYGQEVKFSPWCDGNHFKLTMLHTYEQLGGPCAYGNVEMEWDGTSAGFNMIMNDRTATVSFSSKTGMKYTFQVVIIKIGMSHNIVNMDFVVAKDARFFKERMKTIYEDSTIKEVVAAVYGRWGQGKFDYRTYEPDITGKRDYYQVNETDHEMLVRLCYSWRKGGIFGFGWDGLLIKDHCGLRNSKGNDEGPEKNRLEVRTNSELEVLDQYTWSLDEPGLYRDYYNTFTKGSPAELKSYDNWHPVHYNPFFKFGTHDVVSDWGVNWTQHHQNYLYNTRMLNTELYHSLRVTSADIPNYKLGDILYLRRDDYLYQSHHHKGLYKWPYKFYQVYSNEYFMTFEDSAFYSEDGGSVSFTSRLKCIEKSSGDSWGDGGDPGEKDPTAD